ncbi:MAG: hypothetical protein ACTHOI_04290, partial [Sphingomicrobium sp.]
RHVGSVVALIPGRAPQEMNDDSDDERAHLERINDELNQGLERCRDLLKTHRSQLAANSNDADAADGEENELPG